MLFSAPLPQPQLKVKCRFCDSEDTRPKGYTKQGKRRYLCKSCGRRFVLNPQRRALKQKITKPKKPKNRAKKPKNKPKTSKIEPEKPEIKPKPVLKPRKVHINLDNVIGVPCFLCPTQNTCEPELCVKLEELVENG